MTDKGSSSAPAVGTAAAGDGGRAGQALELVQQGRALLERARLPGAQRKFQQAVRRCATSVAARSHLALTYLLQNAHDRAAVEARAALLLQPDHLLALSVLARAQAGLGQAGEARKTAREAYRTFLLRGRDGRIQREDLDHVVAALAAAGDDRRLNQLYRLCVRGAAGPWDPYTLIYLGVAAFNLERWREARWLWRAAGGLRPELDDIVASFLFAVDLVESGRVPPLSLDYRIELELPLEADGDPPGCMRAAALRTLWEGLDEEARAAALDVLIQLDDAWVAAFLLRIVRDPDLPDWLKMEAGAWLVERGLVDEDEPLEMHINGALREVVIRQKRSAYLPREAAGWYERALEARDRGDTQTAEENYRRVLDVNPSFVPALVSLASIYLRSGRCQQAEEVLNRALQEEPGDPVILLHVAVLLAEQERLGEAREVLSRVDRDKLPRELWVVYYGLSAQVALERGRLASTRTDSTGKADRKAAWSGRAGARARWRPIQPDLSWKDALARLTLAQLADLARRLRVRAPSKLRKAELIDEVWLALSGRLPWVWGQLRRVDRNAVMWLHEQGGVAPYAELCQRFGGSTADAFDAHAGEPTGVADRLQWWGLVFTGVSPEGSHPVAVLPDEIRSLVELVLPRS